MIFWGVDINFSNCTTDWFRHWTFCAQRIDFVKLTEIYYTNCLAACGCADEQLEGRYKEAPRKGKDHYTMVNIVISTTNIWALKKIFTWSLLLQESSAGSGYWRMFNGNHQVLGKSCYLSLNSWKHQVNYTNCFFIICWLIIKTI